MDATQLYAELTDTDHSLANRSKYAALIIAQPELMPSLLDILFMVDDKVSCKAAWVFEFICGTHLEQIIPYLDYFTEHMHLIHLDPAVRPTAKICEYLAKAYHTKASNKIQHSLTQFHQEKIIEACFDWLLTDEKVAPKAYAMSTLFLMGTYFDWVHPELAVILERDFQLQSAAFKSRARKILKKIKTS